MTPKEKLQLAVIVVDLLEDQDSRDAVAILEIAALLLFTGNHVKLELERF